MGHTQEKPGSGGMNISVKSFITAIAMLAALMVLTYVLTFFVPAGAFERTELDGQMAVLPDTYHAVEGGIPFWKWLLSPILVLFSEGNVTIIAILVFLFVIGGVFHCLDESGLMRYMLGRIVRAFRHRRYQLICIVTLFFMAMGTLVGSFEECVPLVPIAAALAASMGWDAMVGLGMSLLAIGCGFATGICNPFTVGVAQQLAGLPMFSGALWRAGAFAVLYPCLCLFLVSYAKKIEARPEKGALAGRAPGMQAPEAGQAFVRDRGMDKGLALFAGILGAGIVLIFSSSFIPALQGVLLPLVAVIFLVAGLAASIACGLRGKKLAGFFRDGAVSLVPAVALILMASSVRYTLEQAHILDTVLNAATQLTQHMPKGATALFLYALVLVMNFFISSGSAKAFLLMPLITPIADLCGLSRQVSILAFAFGDGFSNVFDFTNPVLLISLGLVGVGYGAWARWSGKFQLIILAVTGGILLLASAVM